MKGNEGYPRKKRREALARAISSMPPGVRALEKRQNYVKREYDEGRIDDRDYDWGNAAAESLTTPPEYRTFDIKDYRDPRSQRAAFLESGSQASRTYAWRLEQDEKVYRDYQARQAQEAAEAGELDDDDFYSPDLTDAEVQQLQLERERQREEDARLLALRDVRPGAQEEAQNTGPNDDGGGGDFEQVPLGSRISSASGACKGCGAKTAMQCDKCRQALCRQCAKTH